MSRTVELTIERLSQLGEGTAALEGRAVFVRGALPGERIRADVSEDHGILRGRLESVLAPSPSRRQPSCAVADRCGGCDWLQLDEAAQREAKREIVLSALEHLGGISRSALEVAPVLTAGPSMGYRRRAVLHPHRGALGFFEHKSHQRVTVDRCPALVSGLEPLPGTLRELLKPVLADAEEVQLLAIEGQGSLAASLKTAVKDSHRRAAEAVIRAGHVRGVVLVPLEGSAFIAGNPVLRGPAPLRPQVPLFFRADAFAQANGPANDLLVEAALSLLGPTEITGPPTESGPAGRGGTGEPAARVLELYSGNGNFSFALAERVGSVLGVESSSLAVELARRSVAEAKLENVRFILGDTQKVVQGLIAEGRKFDSLLLDPPRTGAKGCEAWATALGVHRVVYVACDPGALARDAKALAAAGFRPSSLRIVDMFPQTRHVEAVMRFDRVG